MSICLPFLTLFILNGLNLASSREEWIDPHDMNGKSQDILSLNSNCDCRIPISSHCDCTLTLVHFQRFQRILNLLLRSVIRDRSDTFSYKGQLYIDMPIEDYDKLRNFANSNTGQDDATLRSIDEILEKILVKPSYEYYTNAFISWVDNIYFTFYNRTAGILAISVFIIFLSYKLLKANFTIWSVVKYLIFLGWVTDFAFSWIKLIQEAEINKMASTLKYTTIPPACDPQKMTWWQYVTYTFGSADTCREYHQTMFTDHFWSIGPVTILSHQLGTLILTPASYVGEALGSFVNGILSRLPFGVNIILLPLLLIFSMIILCIFFIFITETTVRCNILHVIQLQFGKDERQSIGDALSGRNLSTLLNTVHRNMIEEVRQAQSNENTTTAEDSNFREAGNGKKTSGDLKIELKNDCDGSNEVSVLERDSPIAHDGSGDKVECSN